MHGTARVLLGVSVLFLASCADPGASGDSPPYVTQDGEAIVSCGGPHGFPVSVLPDGIENSDTDEIREVLTQHRIDAGIDAPVALQESSGAEVSMSVLRSEDDGVLVALGAWSATGPGDDGSVLWLSRTSDTFRVDSWGGCTLSPVLPSPEDLWVEVAAPNADPSSSLLTLDLEEGACLSGREPDDFLNESVVVQTPDSVTIYWTSILSLDSNANLEGLAFTCPSNPIVTRTIELDQSLGSRMVLDGSRWPAADVKGTRLANDFRDVVETEQS